MLLSALFSGAGAAALTSAGLALACLEAGFLAVAFFAVFFALARLAAEADAPDFVRVGFLVAR
jgi:hypothetical protein